MDDAAGNLANLHDIIVPAAVSWLPPAPGWYVLAVVLSLVALWKLAGGIKHHRENAYRRAAVTELAVLKHQVEDAGERVSALQAVPELLKRAALVAYPRVRVAHLGGADWFDFLDRSAGMVTFSGRVGQILETAAYQPVAAGRLDDAEIEQMFSAAENWLQRHRRNGDQD